MVVDDTDVVDSPAGGDVIVESADELVLGGIVATTGMDASVVVEPIVLVDPAVMASEDVVEG